MSKDAGRLEQENSLRISLIRRFLASTVTMFAVTSVSSLAALVTVQESLAAPPALQQKGTGAVPVSHGKPDLNTTAVDASGNGPVDPAPASADDQTSAAESGGAPAPAGVNAQGAAAAPVPVNAPVSASQTESTQSESAQPKQDPLLVLQNEAADH